MPSTNLGIASLSSTQTQKEVTINGAVDALDKATQGYLALTITGNTTLTENQFEGAHTFKLNGTPGAFNFDVPTTIHPFVVWNNTGVTATVRKSGGGGSTITVDSGEVKTLQYDGSGIIQIGGAGVGGGSSAFASLTDAFGFTDQAGRFARVNAGETALEPAVIPGPSWRGVLAYRSSNLATSGANTGVIITMNAVDYDTDHFWDSGAPTRLTVPSGISYVRVNASWRTPNGDVANGANMALEILKNGSPTYVGSAQQNGQVGYTDCSVSAGTPIIPVSAGDYFELKIYCSNSTTPTMLANQTWISLEAVEPGFLGALVSLPSDATLVAAGTGGSGLIGSGATPTYNFGKFWDSGSPNGFTIPSGVRKVRISAGFGPTNGALSSAGQTYEIALRKGGSTFNFVGNTERNALTAFDSIGISFVSGVIPVVPGDFYDPVFFIAGHGSNFSSGKAQECWISIEAIEVEGQVRHGALAKFDANTAVNVSGGPTIDFQSAAHDTEGIWNLPSPKRVTVPPGARKVRISAGAKSSGSITSGSNNVLFIEKNGSQNYPGSPNQAGKYGFAVAGESIETAPINVVPGDYFELQIFNASGSITYGADVTWISMDVVDSVPQYVVGYDDALFFVSGTPSATQVILSKIFNRPARLAIGGGQTQISAGTAATGTATFTLKRNGSSIGTFAFAASGTVPTYTISSAVHFSKGDVLTIEAPGTPDATLANITGAIELIR